MIYSFCMNRADKTTSSLPREVNISFLSGTWRSVLLWKNFCILVKDDTAIWEYHAYYDHTCLLYSNIIMNRDSFIWLKNIRITNDSIRFRSIESFGHP